MSESDFFRDVRTNNIENVRRYLLEGGDANEKNNYGITPLFIAQSEEMFRLLIEHGADINKKAGLYKATPLHYCSNEPLEFTEILLEHGASVNKKDLRGMTPLHWTCNKSYFTPNEIIEILLKFGADPNAKDDQGCTPLHYASRNKLGNKVDEAIAKLLEYGADYTIENNFGMKCFDGIPDDVREKYESMEIPMIKEPDDM
jgi:ankyrin repeat protein